MPEFPGLKRDIRVPLWRRSLMRRQLAPAVGFPFGTRLAVLWGPWLCTGATPSPSTPASETPLSCSAHPKTTRRRRCLSGPKQPGTSDHQTPSCRNAKKMLTIPSPTVRILFATKQSTRVYPALTHGVSSAAGQYNQGLVPVLC